MRNNKNLHIRLPDGMVIKVSRQARKEKISISEVVRRILEKWGKKYV